MRKQRRDDPYCDHCGRSPDEIKGAPLPGVLERHGWVCYTGGRWVCPTCEAIWGQDDEEEENA